MTNVFRPKLILFTYLTFSFCGFHLYVNNHEKERFGYKFYIFDATSDEDGTYKIVTTIFPKVLNLFFRKNHNQSPLWLSLKEK